ncbi:YcfA family protein [Candidatus Magnetobacterium bavaricum]|uniref:YcfA family protein n=1 Tax=Candidatus Magnetobacterium bavaricum TaxID=29290 RepID=A0A0F3GPM4_9BACT|nr:YcfA family protein [Candidatus Magnetobacterium bavaricum]
MTKLPSISGKKLISVLKKAGFTEVKQRSSHVSLIKHTREKTYKTVVPLHKTIAKGTLFDILHQTGISKEELIRLMEG